MNKLAKFGAGIATSGFFMFALATGVFAETNLTIGGNGAGSTNTIAVTKVCSTEVRQNSNVNLGVEITSNNNTGNISATGNVGGSVNQTSGNIRSDISVAVTGGSNTATLPDCCCGGEGDSDINQTVTGNGGSTNNHINTTVINDLYVKQKSKINAGIGITSRNRTGRLRARNNTGTGVTQSSGNIHETLGVTVEGGTNTLE